MSSKDILGSSEVILNTIRNHFWKYALVGYIFSNKKALSPGIYITPKENQKYLYFLDA